jgi:hypothetical protein
MLIPQPETEHQEVEVVVSLYMEQRTSEEQVLVVREMMEEMVRLLQTTVAVVVEKEVLEVMVQAVAVAQEVLQVQATYQVLQFHMLEVVEVPRMVQVEVVAQAQVAQQQGVAQQQTQEVAVEELIRQQVTVALVSSSFAIQQQIGVPVLEEQ